MINQDNQIGIEEKFIENTELFNKLSEPFSSFDMANKNGEVFFNEVCVLREKYNIPELVISYSSNFLNEKCEIKPVSFVAFRGGKRTKALIFDLISKYEIGKAILYLVKEFVIMSEE